MNTSIHMEPSRWVIAFGERGEPEASSYVEPFSYLERKIKVWRQSLDPTKYKRVVDEWWKFFHARDDLFNGIQQFGLDRVLARSRVSDYHMVAFLPKGIVYTDALVVFLFDDWFHFGVIQSSVHDAWSRRYASTLKSDVRYVPPDCFYTFPLPDVASDKQVARLGELYYGARTAAMEGFGIGMTALYSRLHQASDTSEPVQLLRGYTIGLDVGVIRAYGWGDIDLDHGFHQSPRGIRFTMSPASTEMLRGRLLELNHERHSAEVAAGLHLGRTRKTNYGPLAVTNHPTLEGTS